MQKSNLGIFLHSLKFYLVSKTDAKIKALSSMITAQLLLMYKKGNKIGSMFEAKVNSFWTHYD